MKERDREELWKRLEKVRLSKTQSLSGSTWTKGTGGNSQEGPGSQTAASGNQTSKG